MIMDSSLGKNSDVDSSVMVATEKRVSGDRFGGAAVAPPDTLTASSAPGPDSSDVVFVSLDLHTTDRRHLFTDVMEVVKDASENAVVFSVGFSALRSACDGRVEVELPRLELTPFLNKIEESPIFTRTLASPRVSTFRRVLRDSCERVVCFEFEVPSAFDLAVATGIFADHHLDVVVLRGHQHVLNNKPRFAATVLLEVSTVVCLNGVTADLRTWARRHGASVDGPFPGSVASTAGPTPDVFANPTGWSKETLEHPFF